ncbi:MAG TPA: 4Fe-4S dicluster domain-containing protein [Bacteroidota bacterium]|nr:4Fe-4S dicluster domain-containing protein [Bacteroidota bacterium]
MDRRNFMITLGTAASSVAVGETARAEESEERKEFVGVLVDTTRCIGCRSCEMACAEAHGFPEPPTDDHILEHERQPSTTQWSVINRFMTTKGEVFAKRQCMHCAQPACASACLTKAMLKTEDGPVIWREDKCMGCRFCMISCPFDVPKFEYESPIPKIQKCNLCWERLQEGEQPACVEACPAEAIKFGKRKDLLEEAQALISKNPDDYVHHIYGETEAGGTSYLYLSAVPFEQIGFRTDLDPTPYPELSKDYLYAVPIVLTLWPAFLLALSNATKKEHEEPISNEQFPR